ncbi:Hypothetical protein PBC10988_23110 [Planctomycetales bacterium 10988]|nr:Hypothetical protein PBC10988_23110 [Planctomycetales bacterium 10988]
MADLAITPGDVVALEGATFGDGTAGEDVSAGEPVYLDTTDESKIKPAGAGGTELLASVAGIALNNAAAEQPVKYASAGEIDLGVTLVVGEVYVLSSTAGGIAPYGDLSAGDFVTIIGYAKDADTLVLFRKATTVQVPA